MTPEVERVHTRLLSLGPVEAETAIAAARIIREQAQQIERLLDIARKALLRIEQGSESARSLLTRVADEALPSGERTE